MHRSVRTTKGEDRAKKPNQERQPLAWPFATIKEHRENIRCAAMRRHIHQRNQNAEKAQNVQDQNQTFNSGQSPADDRVEKDGEEDNGPDEQCGLVWRRSVFGIAEYNHALDQGGADEAA